MNVLIIYGPRPLFSEENFVFSLIGIASAGLILKD